MDDPFADAPTSSWYKIKAQPGATPLTSFQYPAPTEQVSGGEGGSNVNPFVNAPQGGGKAATSTGGESNPFAAAPSQGMGNYPALGGAPPNSPGSPPGAQTAGWYDRLPGAAREIVGEAGPAMGVLGQAATSGPPVNPATGQVEGQQDQGPAAQLGKYLGSRSPEAGAQALGKVTSAAEDATKQIASFLFTQPGKALGEPQSAVASGERAANDLAGYLFEGGNIGEVGRVPEVVRQTERAGATRNPLLDSLIHFESGGRDITNTHQTTTSGRARGYMQITDGTWREFGGLNTGYATAQDAPFSVQWSIAQRIPLKRWDPKTLNYLRSKGIEINPNETLGENAARYGGGAPEMIRERGDIRAPKGLPAGADVADLPEPRQPNAAWYKEQDDKLFQLRQQATADRIQFNQLIEQMPDEFKTPEMQERFYKYMEGDPNTELSPSEQAFYKATIEPLKREERDLYEELKKTDLDLQDYDPTYAHRIVKGREPVFDALAGERGASANPISGYKSLTAPSLKGRKFFALTDAQGARKLVALDNGRLTEINKRIGTPLQTDVGLGENPIKKLGDKVKIGGKEWTLENARTNEIEDNTDTQYYKNASANTIDNLLRLRAAARAVFHFNDLKNSPEFAMVAKKWDAKNIPPNWVSPHMPLLSGYKMDPLLAHTIDDFYGKPKSDLQDKLARINQFAVRSLFWSPVAHLANTGAFWASARSWDWVTPPGIKSLFVDSAKALREVVTQGPEYQRMLRDGASFVYGGVANQDFYMQMMKRLGEDVKRDPTTWDPIARIMGYGPSDLIKLLYNTSSKILWAGSDAFMMQRIMELKRKGLDSKQAIDEAEKYIPNYRIPPHVLGSRAVAEVLKNPVLTEFSRYHYGAMKQIAQLARDITLGSGKEKFDAVGKIFVTGALLYYVWPVISYGINKLTGDDKLEFGPKGSTKIPADLIELYNGDKSFVQVIGNIVTIAPGIKTAGELYTGFDWFTGDKINGPVDQQKGLVHETGKTADFAAKQLVQPYSMMDQAGRPSTSFAKEALKTGLGLRNKPKKYTPSKYDWRKDAKRKKGLIEQGVDKL